MSNICTICRRELAACYLSPVAYVTTAIFLLVANATFVVGVLRNLGGDEPLPTLLFNAIALSLPILVTVITMRLFAEEKRSGTIEILLTAPVRDVEVVLGKYAAALIFAALALAPAVAAIFALDWLCPGVTLADVDPGAVLAGSLLLAAQCAMFTALGTLISLTSPNQIVSGIACFLAIWLALMLGWLLSLAPGVPPRLAEAVAATTHLEDFARGVIDARPLLLYASGTALLLFVAVRLLETRRWAG